LNEPAPAVQGAAEIETRRSAAKGDRAIRRNVSRRWSVSMALAKAFACAMSSQADAELRNRA
jgi:hypothetical protein